MAVVRHPTAAAVLALVAVWLVRFFVKAVRHRRRFSKLPGPPHHPIFGHLISMGKVTTRLPNRVHPHVFAYYVDKEYHMPPIMYLDLFPVGPSMAYVLDPDASYDVSANSGLPKHEGYQEHIGPLTGLENLLLSEGAIWKKWRAIFNPGFSIQHLMSQIPVIVDAAQDYVKILDQHASKKDVFRLEEEATKVTVDVIGKVILDHDFNTLTAPNEFSEALRGSLSWCPDTQTLNPFHRHNPLRPLFQRYYKRKMDNYIGKVLDERFKVREADAVKKARKRSGIDLALEAYFKENGQDIDSRNATMNAEFRRNAIDNMLVLLFAGHDTTASTVCYTHHMLAKHPEALARLRKELDDVFGARINAAEQLRNDPYIINKCEYLAAVIKEVLRLWSPGSTVRQGRKGYFLRDPVTGEILPTEGIMVWPVLSSMHRDRRIWGADADEFKPERFLPENIDKVNPNAYRPFEKGPRNCIGQELANIELKVILALTIREFDVTTAFDQLSQLRNDGSLWAAWKMKTTGPQECYGDEMYQVLMASAKPREGMPARVVRRAYT